jgi:hypothetical protein
MSKKCSGLAISIHHEWNFGSSPLHKSATLVNLKVLVVTDRHFTISRNLKPVNVLTIVLVVVLLVRDYQWL